MKITTEALVWEVLLVHVKLTLPGAQCLDSQPNYTPDYQRILLEYQKVEIMLIIFPYSDFRSKPGLSHESPPYELSSGIWRHTPLQMGLNQTNGFNCY